MTKVFACAAAAILIAGPAAACGWNKSAQAPAPGVVQTTAYEAPVATIPAAAQTVAASDVLIFGAQAKDHAMSYAPTYQDAVVFTLD